MRVSFDGNVAETVTLVGKEIFTLTLEAPVWTSTITFKILSVYTLDNNGLDNIRVWKKGSPVLTFSLINNCVTNYDGYICSSFVP